MSKLSEAIQSLLKEKLGKFELQQKLILLPNSGFVASGCTAGCAGDCQGSCNWVCQTSCSDSCKSSYSK